MLNHVVDALLSADELDVNDGIRATVLRNLCYCIFEMKQQKADLGCFTDSLFPQPQSKYANESESLGFNVLLASFLDRGVDANDESLAILETAVASDNLEMLHLLMTSLSTTQDD